MSPKFIYLVRPLFLLLLIVLCFVLVPMPACNRPLGRTTGPRASAPADLRAPADLGCAAVDLREKSDLGTPRDLGSPAADLSAPPPVSPKSTTVASGCGAPWELLFDLNSAALQPLNTVLLRQVVSCAGPATLVTIIGHGDERGTGARNQELGAQRAAAVAAALRALGMPQAQMRPQSAGASAPVCGEHEERCWQRNRRVIISVVLRPAA